MSVIPRLLGVLGVFVLLVWIPVETAWGHYCFNNYDLGILSQAVYLVSFNAWNPWLSVRDIHLFNDHFDPVIFGVAFFRSWVHPSLLIIRFDMIAIILASLAPIYLFSKRIITRELGLIACVMILFSPMVLDAAFFPAHPSTWSLAPLSWLMAFLLTGSHRNAVLLLLVFLACKEEYPIVGAVMGAGLFYSGRRQVGLWFLSLSILWFIGVFVVRPMFIDPSGMYTGAVTQGAGLKLFLSWDSARPVLGRLAAVALPLGVVASRFRQTSFKNIEWMFVMSLISLLAVRFVGGFWGNHRSSPLAIATVFTLIGFAKGIEMSRARRYMLVALVVVFAFPSLELGTRMWRGKSFKKHCDNNQGRVQSLDQANLYLRDHQDGVVLAQGNLIPRLSDLQGISHVGATNSGGFKYFFIEKSPLRNTFPLAPQEFAAIERQWRQSQATVIIDDEHVLLMRNPDH